MSKAAAAAQSIKATETSEEPKFCFVYGCVALRSTFMLQTYKHTTSIRTLRPDFSPTGDKWGVVDKACQFTPAKTIG